MLEMMPTEPIPSLTPTQFRRKLRQLGLPQRRFAQMVQMDVSTVNRWANGRGVAVPHWVSLLLDLMIATKAHEDVHRKK